MGANYRIRKCWISPLKYDFEDNFYVPDFEVTKDVHVVHQNSGHKNYKDRLSMLGKVQQEWGHVDPRFKNNQKLTITTTSEYYSDIFQYFSKNIQVNKEMIISEKKKSLTNLTEVFSGAGQGVTCYTYFRTFKLRELRHNFGLYIIHGIYP